MGNAMKPVARRVLSACLPMALALAFFSTLASQGPGETMRRLTLNEMSRKSDVIVIGRVAAKRTQFQDNRIQTHYEIDANEYLKGQDWIDRGLVGPTVDITQLGGAISEPFPITQRISSAPTMFKEEKVLLFLDMKTNHGRDGKKASRRKSELRAADAAEGAPRPREISPDSKLLSTPLIVGAWQGRFTIFENEEGDESAIQVRSDLGGLPRNEGMRKFMAAAAARSRGGEAAFDGETQDETPELLIPKALRSRARTIDDIKADIRKAIEEQAAGESGETREGTSR